jgi:hypothetical protein
MGINYHQYAILGIRIDESDIKYIESPAFYENQNRYNTTTGQVKGTERVKVKDEVSYCMFMGTKYDELYDIEYDKKYEELIANFDSEENCLYLGVEVCDTKDFGRANLLDGGVSISELKDSAEIVKKYFPDLEIKLYFFSSVG